MEVKIKMTDGIWEKRIFLSNTAEEITAYLNSTYGGQGVNWDFI